MNSGWIGVYAYHATGPHGPALLGLFSAQFGIIGNLVLSAVLVAVAWRLR